MVWTFVTDIDARLLVLASVACDPQATHRNRRQLDVLVVTRNYRSWPNSADAD